ncbi:MAG: PD40 domain-containing protein [Anaerolineae bacterium]|nr:PD40 domain-containing protein [Anaerolineae bacterium]
MSSNFEDAAERKKRIERQLHIARSKESARGFEEKNEWTDALRLYTEILKDDPTDEEAQSGEKRSRESLMIWLYAKGEEQLAAGEWAAAITTLDQLLEEAHRAGLNNYQDARAKRQLAQEKINPPPSPPSPRTFPIWAIAGGMAGILLILAIVFISLLRPHTVISGGDGTATLVAVDTATTVPTTATFTVEPTPTNSPTLESATNTAISELASTFTPTPESVSTTPTTEPTPTDTLTPEPATTTPSSKPADTDTPTPTSIPTDTPTPEQVIEVSSPSHTLTGKIAVPVFDTGAGTYNVYIASAVEDWQPRLFLADASQPAFSPDGRWIILRTWPSTTHRFGQRLVLFPSLSMEANDIRFMTQNLEDAHPSLRSDGEIVFHTRREGPPVLFTLGTWEGAESNVANQNKLGVGENPAWLGNRIIYYTSDSSPGLYVKNSDGSTNLILKSPSSVVPATAPDGDRVAVSLKRDANWHVFVLSASKGQDSLTQLTTENADDLLPVWSPDGQSIAFVSNREGNPAVWVMNADGTNQRKLFDLNGPINGRVSHALDKSFGWGEEQLSWAP